MRLGLLNINLTRACHIFAHQELATKDPCLLRVQLDAYPRSCPVGSDYAVTLVPDHSHQPIDRQIGADVRNLVLIWKWDIGNNMTDLVIPDRDGPCMACPGKVSMTNTLNKHFSQSETLKGRS